MKIETFLAINLAYPRAQNPRLRYRPHPHHNSTHTSSKFPGLALHPLTPLSLSIPKPPSPETWPHRPTNTLPNPVPNPLPSPSPIPPRITNKPNPPPNKQTSRSAPSRGAPFQKKRKRKHHPTPRTATPHHDIHSKQATERITRSIREDT